MTPQILREIYTFLDMSKSDDITFWYLCLFMFFLMVRKSNSVPISVEELYPSKQPIRQDVKVFQDVLVVLIKWSKTNQFGSRLLQVPLVAIPESVLCPVLAFKNMIRATPALVHDPAFVRRTDKARINPLLQEKIKILKLEGIHSCIHHTVFVGEVAHGPSRQEFLLISFNTTGTGYLIVTKDTWPLILRRSYQLVKQWPGK